MYSSFFGFKENPFNLTPDPSYLFLSSYHKEAFYHLLYGIYKRKGFIVIVGGIGTGKTTLCRALLNHLDKSTKSAFIFNPFISDMELLKTINEEFGIEMNHLAKTKKDYIDALNRFLLDNFSQGGNAVLILDEAQNLNETVLEQVRILSNLETEGEKLIQIVLVGQSELKDLLAVQSLRQLNERVMVHYNLEPLDFKDIKRYVQHRLAVAGGSGNLKFTGGTFNQIYGYSQGNPRRINLICDRALLIAYAKETYDISKGIIKKALQEIHGDKKVETRVAAFSRSIFQCFSLTLFSGVYPMKKLLKMIKRLFSGRNYKIKTESSSSYSENTPEKEIKVGVFKFKGTLKSEFSNSEEAQEFVSSIAEKHPNLKFEPYLEKRSGLDRRCDNERRSGSDRRSGDDRRSGMVHRITLSSDFQSS